MSKKEEPPPLTERVIKKLLNKRLIAVVIVPVIIITAFATSAETLRNAWKTWFHSEAPISIALVQITEKSLWTQIEANTSRDHSVGFGGKRFPLYTGQVSLNHIKPELRERAKTEMSLDPVFDVVLVNNSDNVVLIDKVSFVVDKAWTLPAQMPTAGELKVQDVIVIKIERFDRPSEFSTKLTNPVSMPPKTPYRVLVYLEGLHKGSVHNEILARLVFHTTSGTVSTVQINLSMI